MAFYAEMVRRGSWLVNHANMIYYYQGVLLEQKRAEAKRKHEEYVEWYNSLTDEEREKVDRYQREQKEKRERETMESFMRLMSIPLMFARALDRSYPDKYGGMYNRDGTINEDYFRNKREREEKEAIDVEAVEL